MKKYFICASEKYCELYNHVSAPYIRKDFYVSEFKNAKIRICGLGFYELFLNDQKITKGKLAPYISNPDHLIYYDEYDITNLLIQGGNAVGVILGNGFLNNIGGYPWEFDKAHFRHSPILSLVLYIDGKELFHTDESFRTAPSPIYFDDLRCGEYYDARKEQKGWSTYGFEDSTWSFVKNIKAPKGKPVKADVAPIKIINEIFPISVNSVNGGFVFDFGINSAGICRIVFKGYKGQKIVLRHAETILEDGSVYMKNTCTPDFDIDMSQKDIFICSGREDVFEPSFTYHGFRYVFVEGVSSEDIVAFSITMLQLSADLTQTGFFHCSNGVINLLHNITVNSDRSNFFYFPTDCPQREKNGWTADAALSCEQMLYNLDCSDSLQVWLDNVRCTQRENGQLPGVVPTVNFGYDWGSGPAWDAVIVELPYQIYRFTGNKKVLQDNAEAIMRYIAYLKTKTNENGLISFGLPDWCECGKPTEGNTSTPLEITDTLVSIEICQKAEKIFSILGKSEYAVKASEFAVLLKKRFRTVWVDEKHFVKCKTQTAQAKAIDVGVFTKNEIQHAVENLVNIISDDGGHFQVGVIGARVLFRILADNGYGDLALDLITKEGFPSYKYWLDNGATSLWECFNELENNKVFRKDGGRVLSLNHHFWGDISAWFYRYILGINVNPNLKNDIEFEINPIPLADVNYAKGSYIRNGKGVIVERKMKGGKIYLTIKTLGDTKYKLCKNCDNVVFIR